MMISRKLFLGMFLFCSLFFLQKVILAQVLFSDDFNRADGAPGNGWEIHSGECVIEDNKLKLTSLPGIVHARVFNGSSSWTNYKLEYDWNWASTTHINTAVFFRFIDWSNYYHFVTDNGYFRRIENGTCQFDTYYSGGEGHVEINVSGENIKIYINSSLVLDFDDTGTGVLNGKFALDAYPDGAGAYGQSVYFDNVRVSSISPPIVEAEIDFDPNVLNVRSKGKWMTCYIEPTNGIDINEIDISTVQISQIGTDPIEILAASKPTTLGDHDEDGTPDMMVKFDRQGIIDALNGTDVEMEFTVIGDAGDYSFEGTEIVKIISRGKKKESFEMELDNPYPEEFILHQNYPNPFNPTTHISYTIPKENHVALVIYNIAGERVITLFDGQQKAGFYSVTWDGRDDQGRLVSGGIYLCRLNAGTYNKTIPMTLLK